MGLNLVKTGSVYVQRKWGGVGGGGWVGVGRAAMISIGV